MKKLRDILEADVVNLDTFRKSKSKDLMTHDRAVRDIAGIVTSNRDKWAHPNLTNSIDHPVESIHNTLFRGSLPDAPDTNSRKLMAREHFRQNRKPIMAHIDNTIRSLDALHNKYGNSEFASNWDQLKTKRDLNLTYKKWNTMKENLSSIE